MEIKKKAKRNWLGILGLIAFAVSIPLILIVAFISSIPDFSGQPHQSDAVLIANFNAHRAEFEKLLAMVLEDKGLTRVDENWTEPKDPQTVGVSQERIAEYRRLFREIGIVRGFSASYSRKDIMFIASAQGWVAHGSSKGYLYGNSPDIERETDSLDKFCSQQPPVGSGRKHIEGKWYLYFYCD